MIIFFFLSSGLFLGWSLGANDAANVFGTSVATRMIKFKTAAIICSIFVVLGACISGAGAAHTLGKLGAVNEIAGSFIVACAAGLTVLWMTKLGLPVSTSQAIVGAIIGWNFFSGSLTDYHSLVKIVSTWALCPILSALFAILFFWMLKAYLRFVKIHLFRMDAYTRFGLIVVGAFGSYSLGANNIANVMGVFVEVSPFKNIEILGFFQLGSVHQLFLIGAIAIGVGVFTYSYKVMTTVGQKVVKLTPQAAFIVVLAESIVLFLFASQALESWLISHNLPTIPLVPVSSSQAVIGAVIGIGIAKGGKNIRWNVLGNISLGWMTTPILSGILSFVALFFFQNVFDQKVYRFVPFQVSKAVEEKIKEEGLKTKGIDSIKYKKFENAQMFLSALKKIKGIDGKTRKRFIELAKLEKTYIPPLHKVKRFNYKMFTKEQLDSLAKIANQRFLYKWQLQKALFAYSKQWKYKLKNIKNKQFNTHLKSQLKYLCSKFRIEE